MLKLRKNKKGFTLVELIVVIAIMAVLAGTVAGVTVSQLNKRTDEANHTQAKKIADTIYEELLANVGGDDIVADKPAQNATGASMQEIVEEAFGSIIKWGSSATAAAGKEFKVYYTSGLQLILLNTKVNNRMKKAILHTQLPQPAELLKATAKIITF